MPKQPLSRFEKFALGVAPKWTLDRIRSRLTADMLVRHYEAAQPGRRTQNWQMNYGDADANLRGQNVELRNHARDLIRNNAWARRGQRTIANNTVGWGIPAQAQGPFAARAMELWKEFAESTDCETEGRHTFYGIQNLVMKSVVESGEVLLRRRMRLNKDGLTVPMQIQVLEADYLDSSKNLFDSMAGGPIISGVEFDKIGRRSAYWLFSNHPGSGRNIYPSKRVPASEVIHVYYTERPGQSRGVTWFAPGILKLKDFDEYEDATMVRQKVAALLAGIVTDDGSGTPLGQVDDPLASPRIEELQPGALLYLPQGKNVTFSNPPSVTEDKFTERALRWIAASINVTYEDLTLDYSQSNFSNSRAARLSHWAHVHDWRWNMLIPLLCQGVWDWHFEVAVASGLLPSIPAATWTPPPMPMMEPDKEGLAYQRMVRSGMMTHDEMVREQGYDPDTHWTEYAAGLKKLDALGIELDSDPRKMTTSGQAQVAPAEGQSSAGDSQDPSEDPVDNKSGSKA